MLKNKLITLILFLIITFSASFIGGIVSIYYKDPWYSLLTKPSFNPPDWIFAPVWTTLYLMMTFSIWIFWHSKKKRNSNSLYLFHPYSCKYNLDYSFFSFTQFSSSSFFISSINYFDLCNDS